MAVLNLGSKLERETGEPVLKRRTLSLSCVPAIHCRRTDSFVANGKPLAGDGCECAQRKAYGSCTFRCDDIDLKDALKAILPSLIFQRINFDCQELPQRLAAVTMDLGNISTPGELSVSNPKKENPMRRSMIAVLLVASTIPVMAQTNMKPANHDANTPAVNTPNTPPNPGAPVAGANSFTEGQAKSRIESKGFKSVSNLKKDDAGVWRGRAMQNDKTVSVSVDFQGNVVAQ